MSRQFGLGAGMIVLRLIALAGLVYVLYLGFSEGWETAFYAFLVLGVCLWVAATLVELCQRVTGALSRPSVNIEQRGLHVEHVEQHPDPTRPDYEDEYALFITKQIRNGKKK